MYEQHAENTLGLYCPAGWAVTTAIVMTPRRLSAVVLMCTMPQVNTLGVASANSQPQCRLYRKRYWCQTRAVKLHGGCQQVTLRVTRLHCEVTLRGYTARLHCQVYTACHQVTLRVLQAR